MNTWIREFLTNRKMKVGVIGEFSEWNRVMSGVPQGSVLGPILFVLYVNNIPEGVRSLIKLFADDTKVLGKVRNEEDRDMVQRDLDYIEEWSGIWQLGFNLENVNVCTLANKLTHINTPCGMVGRT